MKDIKAVIKKGMENNRGSFTVEAVVLISFLVLTIATIISLSVFLYNKCSMERAAAVGALRGSQAVWEGQNARYEKAEKGVCEIVSDYLLGDYQVNTSVEVKGDDISVALKMNFQQWEFQSEDSKKAINPVAFIRNCRKWEGVIKE